MQWGPRGSFLLEIYITELRKIIWGFLWNNKLDNVKINACTRMTHYGWLGMPDIEKVESKCLGEFWVGISRMETSTFTKFKSTW